MPMEEFKYYGNQYKLILNDKIELNNISAIAKYFNKTKNQIRWRIDNAYYYKKPFKVDGVEYNVKLKDIDTGEITELKPQKGFVNYDQLKYADDTKSYCLYDIDTGECVLMCDNKYELAKILNRSILDVNTSLSKIRRGLNKHIIYKNKWHDLVEVNLDE